jgi:hypothetical protein
MIEDYSLLIPLGRLLFPGEESDRQEFIIPMLRPAWPVDDDAAHKFCPSGEHREIGVKAKELLPDSPLMREERNSPLCIKSLFKDPFALLLDEARIAFNLLTFSLRTPILALSLAPAANPDSGHKKTAGFGSASSIYTPFDSRMSLGF